MRLFLIMLVFSLQLSSCLEPKSKSHSKAINDSIEIDSKIEQVKNPFKFQNTKEGKPATLKFPFGNNFLGLFKFPDTILYDESSDALLFEKKLTTTISNYEKLNNVEIFQLPDINTWKYINIPFITNYKDSISEFKFHQYFNYKLPNIGPYECYYSYYKLDISKRIYPYCFGLGYLIIYNVDNKEATIINIYNLTIDEFNEFRRFFFITTDGQINIYDIVGNELEERLTKKTRLNVNPKGLIKIEVLNK